jgi:hypothetical protein
MSTVPDIRLDNLVLSLQSLSYAASLEVYFYFLQVQLLQELVGTSRKMGAHAASTRHMTFLLQVAKFAALILYLDPSGGNLKEDGRSTRHMTFLLQVASFLR